MIGTTRRTAVGGLALLAATILAAPLTAQSRPPAKPAPELERLAGAIVGNYDVVETHHAHSNSAEWVATGRASYRRGPDGLSIVEDYRSSGPRGPFEALAILWWDGDAGAFRHFECESGDPCALVEDRGRWDGAAVVFARHIQREGRTILVEQRYDFSTPGEVVITAEFAVNGGPKTRSMTIAYTRVAAARQTDGDGQSVHLPTDARSTAPMSDRPNAAGR